MLRSDQIIGCLCAVLGRCARVGCPRGVTVVLHWAAAPPAPPPPPRRDQPWNPLQTPLPPLPVPCRESRLVPVAPAAGRPRLAGTDARPAPPLPRSEERRGGGEGR